MTTRSIRYLSLATAAMLSVAVGAAERAIAQAPQRGVSLIRPVATAAPREAPQREAWEARTRLVGINSAALPQRATAEVQLAPATQMSIDLFDGATVTAEFERFDPNASGVTWVGRVPSQPNSRVTLVSGGGVMAASIILEDRSYTIRPAPIDPANPAPAPGAHILTEINSDGFMPEAAPLLPEITEAARDRAAAEIQSDDAGDIIDLLVVYTSLAEAWAGGPAGIVNWINMGVSETNSALATSNVNTRVRLVLAERVAYTEVGNFNTNLTNLRFGGPGLENVAALRNAYTADLVTMFVRPASGATACGIGFLMTSVSTAFAPNGYNVVDAPCSSPNGTLAHEIGHNMGLRHDWYMDNAVTPFTYAHGHVSVAGRFRTIMSYPDACTALAISCARLLAFSNPDRIQNGQPMGVRGGTSTACPAGNANNMSCDADEARALNETALTVSNFRLFSPVRPPTIQSQPESQSAARGQAVTLRVTAEGLGPFTYQWYRGAAPITSSPIAGATGPTVTIVPGNDGIWFERWFYWVRVTNAIGTTSSLTATITLVAPGASPAAPQRTRIARVSGPAPDPPSLPPTRPNGPSIFPGPPVREPGQPQASIAGSPAATGETTNACTADDVDTAIAEVSAALRTGDRTGVMAALVEIVRKAVQFIDRGCGQGGAPLR